MVSGDGGGLLRGPSWFDPGWRNSLDIPFCLYSSVGSSKALLIPVRPIKTIVIIYHQTGGCIIFAGEYQLSECCLPGPSLLFHIILHLAFISTTTICSKMDLLGVGEKDVTFRRTEVRGCFDRGVLLFGTLPRLSSVRMAFYLLVRLCYALTN